MDRRPASERTREQLQALMEGRAEATNGNSELVRVAARLILEQALDGEVRDALRAALRDGPITASEVAHRFPKAPRRRPGEMLRTLAALGQARETSGGRHSA